MKHRVKMATGVSNDYIQFKEQEARTIDNGNLILQDPIGGVRQRCGGSPIILTAVLLIVLQVYKALCKGTTIWGISSKKKVQ